ncbi:MAG: DtxR family transcriptional regulator [Anaerolineae bacterium]
MPEFTDWLWPILSVLFALLWLWTLLRQRRAPTRTLPSTDTAGRRRREAEDLLKTAYALQEAEGHLTMEDLARALNVPESLAQQGMEALIAFGWVDESTQRALRLTNEGENHAQDLIRAHRLWERYLVDQEGMSLEEIHAEAHHREHGMTLEELDRLDAELGHPAWDPHGHAIPESQAHVPPLPGRPLSEEGEPGRPLRVVCLDDKPEPLLAQLLVLGLEPGAEVSIADREADILHVQFDGDVFPLALAAARHVRVVPRPALMVALGELPVGAHAQVVEIHGVGKHQRRMLDMGFVPGADVSVIRKAPLGDPIEYLVKSTSVALRRKEANTILVEEVDHE